MKISDVLQTIFKSVQVARPVLKKTETNPLGSWSALFLLTLIGWIAYRYADTSGIRHGIFLMLSGHPLEINRVHDMLSMLLTSFTLASWDVISSIASLFVMLVLVGKHRGDHSVGDVLVAREGQYFKVFFMVTSIEELFARLLFLGGLWQVFPGTTAFYVLFFLGNGIWSLVHLRNFKNPEDRSVIRVLPQFIGGIFFSYAFVSHGLTGAIMTHFMSNAILFSTAKLQRVNGIDMMIALYSLLCASVSYGLMTKPITDSLQWLSSSGGFVLTGWQPSDYVLFGIFASSVITLVLDVALLDRNGIGGGFSLKIKNCPMALAIVLFVLMFGVVAAVLVASIYVSYWLMSFVSTDIAYRIFIIAVLYCFYQKGTSASGMVRTFFQSVPSIFVTACIFEAIGFWYSVGYMFCALLVGVPNMLLHQLDD